MNPVHAWLVANPIARELIFGALFVVVAFYVTPLLDTSKRFLAIPPQQLNIRILKARLSYAEANLENFYQLHNNLPRFIFTCYLTILTAILSATVFVVGLEFGMILVIAARLGSADGHHLRFVRFLFRYFSMPYSFLLFLYTARNTDCSSPLGDKCSLLSL